jgi:hypothetical protein
MKNLSLTKDQHLGNFLYLVLFLLLVIVIFVVKARNFSRAFNKNKTELAL